MSRLPLRDVSYVVEINARSTQTSFNETNPVLSVLLEGYVGNHIHESLLQDLQRFQSIDLVLLMAQHNKMCEKLWKPQPPSQTYWYCRLHLLLGALVT